MYHILSIISPQQSIQVPGTVHAFNLPVFFACFKLTTGTGTFHCDRVHDVYTDSSFPPLPVLVSPNYQEYSA